MDFLRVSLCGSNLSGRGRGPQPERTLLGTGSGPLSLDMSASTAILAPIQGALGSKKGTGSF